MNQTPKLSNPTEQLDRIIELLERIDKRVNPPQWQQGLVFFFTHFMTFIALITTVFLLWQTYELVSGISSFTEGFFTNLKEFDFGVGAAKEKLGNIKDLWSK